MNLKDAPIKRKLTMIIMMTSTVVLVMVSAPFIIYEVLTFRTTILDNTETIAQIVAANTTAALSFDDEKTATEILSKLAAEETVLKASLYDRDGEMLARYPERLAIEKFPRAPQREGYEFENGELRIIYPVREGNSQLGRLFLATDIAPMYVRLQLYGIIVAIVMAGSLLIAYLLSNWLQKRVSDSILKLAETARAISVKKDYRVRAKKYGADEIGLFTDAFNHMLTEIQARDHSVTESEARVRAVLDSAVSAVVVIDAEGIIIDWNVRAEHLFGWTRREALGRLLRDTIVPERYRQAHQSGLGHYLKTGEGPILNRLLELSAVRRDGSEFPVELSISPIKTGDVTTFCGFITDITERKEAAKGLSLLAAIVESSDDAIVGKDLAGRIVSWNAGAERMFGYQVNEAMGNIVDFIVPKDRIKEEIEALERVKAGKIAHFETIRVRKDGGTVEVSVTMSPIKNATGTIIGASASSRDISARVRAEEEIRKLNIELEERVLLRTSELAATNKELEAFTYSVSHDLRAPLRHIDAFAQILEDELKSGQSAGTSRYISRIRNGVQNMGQLVDDLLNLSRVGRTEKIRVKIQLNKIVDEVLAELKPEVANRQIEWQVGKLPSAECDPGLIKQVFINLISNAIKYTRPRENAVIEIGQKTVRGEVAVYVRDNGVGFSMEYAGKLFGVFQRLHRAEEFEGTGVGLATVQRIVHLHQGQIWGEAELDKGAMFYFTLGGMQHG